MIVVSNTSPLTNLAAIGRFGLLESLFARLHIPQAVYDEIVVRGAGRAGASEVSSAGWITTHAVTDRALVGALELELDSGEAEAIALALEIVSDVVLIDERLGRRVASRMGLRPLGLVGVLLDAKQNSLIDLVAPLLDDLRAVAGFRISPTLYADALRLAGE